jgi:hypothetical protein
VIVGGSIYTTDATQEFGKHVIRGGRTTSDCVAFQSGTATTRFFTDNSGYRHMWGGSSGGAGLNFNYPEQDGDTDGGGICRFGGNMQVGHDTQKGVSLTVRTDDNAAGDFNARIRLYESGNDGFSFVYNNTTNNLTINSVASGSETERMSIDSSTGAVDIVGAISKGSGTFNIPHVLPGKKDTHRLIHSFVEAPQPDLYYRGELTMSGSSATVNLDTHSNMTKGTFETLNGKVQAFVSNQDNFIGVRGKVEGAVLTVHAASSLSVCKVSWLVVGQRKDQTILDTICNAEGDLEVEKENTLSQNMRRRKQVAENEKDRTDYDAALAALDAKIAEQVEVQKALKQAQLDAEAADEEALLD